MTFSDLIKVTAFVAYRDNNGRLREAARCAGISVGTMSRWKNEPWWESLGKTVGHQGRNRSKRSALKTKRPSKLKPDVIEKVKMFYKNNGHALQINLQHHLREEGVIISRSSTCRAVKMANLSRKRLSSHVLGQQNDDKVIAFNDAYHRLVTDASVVIVSTDEMYASEKVIPTHVYSEVGCKRCLTKQKSGGWKQRSLIQSIASDGSKYHEIVQGTINRNRFIEYIQNLPYPQGTIILMDELHRPQTFRVYFSVKRIYSSFFITLFSRISTC
jgi:hypothetical protein